MYSSNIDWIQEKKNMLDFHDNADADSSTLRADMKVSRLTTCLPIPTVHELQLRQMSELYIIPNVFIQYRYDTRKDKYA